MCQYIQEKYANITFHLYLILKNMAYSISKDPSNISVGREEKGSLWKHFVWTILASIPYLTQGVETPALTTSVHSGHFIIPVAQDHVPWTTTAAIASSALCAPLYCYFVNRFGRKYIVYFISLVQGASCIPLFLPPMEYSAIILHILAGIASGGLFTVLPAYIRELSDDRIRGFSLMLMAVMTTLGYLVRLFVEEEIAMFIMVGLIAVQFLTMFAIPESPTYLVMKGKIEAARSSVSSLKCLKEDHVCVIKTVDQLKEESERAKHAGSDGIGFMKNRLYLDILKIGVALHTAITFCGNIVFLDQEKSLAQLKMALDPEKTLIVTCMVAGSLACLILIQFVERRYLLTLGFITMALSLGVLAVYTQAHLTVASYRLVPVVALGVLVVAFGFAWALPTVIFVEILNLEIRATMLGIIFTYTQILKLIHIHMFEYIEDNMGIFTLLYIFAGVNLIAVVYTLFIVPDIKDNNVQQIERQMKRIPLLHFKTDIKV